MSLDRCPGCRARLAPEAPSCPRCGCDLALVRQVEQHAQAALGRALRAWAGGDLPGALAHARVAQGLHGEPLTVAVVRCLAGIDVEATLRTPSPASAGEVHLQAPSPTSVGEGWGEGGFEVENPPPPNHLNALSSPPEAPSPD